MPTVLAALTALLWPTPRLTGTSKQIAWASDLLEHRQREAAWVLAIVGDLTPGRGTLTEARLEEALADVRAGLAKLGERTSAGYWIDTRDRKFEGMMAYAIAMPGSGGDAGERSWRLGKLTTLRTRWKQANKVGESAANNYLFNGWSLERGGRRAQGPEPVSFAEWAAETSTP
jgi:hypothetical protein